MTAFVPTLPSPANDNAQTEAAFAARFLTVLSYAAGFTHWHYRGSTLAHVTRPAFFNPADMLAPGDVVWISARDGFVSHYILQPGPGLKPGPDMRSLLIERTAMPPPLAGEMGAVA